MRRYGKNHDVQIRRIDPGHDDCAGRVRPEYYVSTKGSDSNRGTRTSPLRTIEHGVSKLSAGDTLNIRGGTYREEFVANGINGSAGKPITITSCIGETVTLDGTEAISAISHGRWEKYSGNIYKINLTKDIWQLFDDGEMVISARWPNESFDNLWGTDDNWAKARKTSADGHAIDDPHDGIGLAASARYDRCNGDSGFRKLDNQDEGYQKSRGWK